MISEFQNEYRFLSNFWWARVTFDGHEYPTVEHAYAAAKTTSDFYRSQIRSAPTPAEAKRRGRMFPLREDWEAIKLGVMEDLVRQKFADPELRQKLVDTAPHELVEGNAWGDKFWGRCQGVGENHMGRILMRIREEIRPTDLMPVW